MEMLFENGNSDDFEIIEYEKQQEFFLERSRRCTHDSDLIEFLTKTVFEAIDVISMLNKRIIKLSDLIEIQLEYIPKIDELWGYHS